MQVRPPAASPSSQPLSRLLPALHIWLKLAVQWVLGLLLGSCTVCSIWLPLTQVQAPPAVRAVKGEPLPAWPSFAEMREIIAHIGDQELCMLWFAAACAFAA